MFTSCLLSFTLDLFTAYSLVADTVAARIVVAAHTVVVAVGRNTCHQLSVVGPGLDPSVPHGKCTPSPVVPSHMEYSSRRRGNRYSLIEVSHDSIS